MGASTLFLLSVLLPTTLAAASHIAIDPSGASFTIFLEESHDAPSLPALTAANVTLDHSVPFPVFYLNLDKSTERRQRMEETFGSLWDLRRFPAIDGRNVTLREELIEPKAYAKLKDRLRNYTDTDQVTSIGAIVSPSELGAVLSHLMAIRTAYFEGLETVMIVEDDLSASLMPYWTTSVQELVQEAEKASQGSKGKWEAIQLGWLCLELRCIKGYGANEVIFPKDRQLSMEEFVAFDEADKKKRGHVGSKHHLVQRQFDYGPAAYLVSRRGMEKVIKKYFTDKTPGGILKPLLKSGNYKIHSYLAGLSPTFVATPSFFSTHAESTTIGEGPGVSKRLFRQQRSNDMHMNKTKELIENAAAAVATAAAAAARAPAIHTVDVSVPFPVFYINLDRSHERQQHMAETFGSLGWDLRRFPAVDGRNATFFEEIIDGKVYQKYKKSIRDDSNAPLTLSPTLSSLELGAILSHLMAIRAAYLEGLETVMIVEDDLSPLLMPHWTASIAALVGEANMEKEEGKEDWKVLQLAWLCFYGRCLEKYGPNLPDPVASAAVVDGDGSEGNDDDGLQQEKHRLVARSFDIGAAAYILSRSGMQAVMDSFFTDHTAAGLVRPITKGRSIKYDSYMRALGKSLVAVPSLFTVTAQDTHMEEGEAAAARLAGQRRSNEIHLQKTLELTPLSPTKKIHKLAASIDPIQPLHEHRLTTNYSVPFPVVYINLDRSIERRKHMEETFGTGLGWDLRRFSALDGRNATFVERFVEPAGYQKLMPHLRDVMNITGTSFKFLMTSRDLATILSHLTAIRKAFLEGHEAVMIVEDDLSPLLMQHWTSPIQDLVQQAEEQAGGRKQWNIIQLSWLCFLDSCIKSYGPNQLANRTPKKAREQMTKAASDSDSAGTPGQHRLIQQHCDFGAAAYLISRSGMEAVMDLYFTDRTAGGLLKPLVKSRNLKYHAYLAVIPQTYVVSPSLFGVLAADTNMEEDKAKVTKRLAQQQRSNDLHLQHTMELTQQRQRQQQPDRQEMVPPLLPAAAAAAAAATPIAYVGAAAASGLAVARNSTAVTDYSVPFPVFYINLDRSPDRRRRMEELFGSLWDLRRFPAVDGSSITFADYFEPQGYSKLERQIQNDYPEKRGFKPTLNHAEVGTILSHLTAIRKAYLDGLEAVMIVEDDLSPSFMPYWTRSIGELMKEAELGYHADKWDIIQLAWLCFSRHCFQQYDGNNPQLGRRNPMKKKKRDNMELQEAQSLHKEAGSREKHQIIPRPFDFGAAAYIISRSGMEAVMNAHFTNRTATGLVKPVLDHPLFITLESYLSDVAASYVVTPSLFDVEAESSTILEGGDEADKRVDEHVSSNQIHLEKTLEMFR